MSRHAPGSGTITALPAPRPSSPAREPASEPARTRAPALTDGDPIVVRDAAALVARRLRRIAGSSLDRIRQR